MTVMDPLGYPLREQKVRSENTFKVCAVYMYNPYLYPKVLSLIHIASQTNCYCIMSAEKGEMNMWRPLSAHTHGLEDLL